MTQCNIFGDPVKPHKCKCGCGGLIVGNAEYLPHHKPMDISKQVEEYLPKKKIMYNIEDGV